MSSMSQFFGGGGVYSQYATLASGTFTCPVTGKYLVTAIGGGGAGLSNGRGGCGAGLAQSLVQLTAGSVITFSVGAGGINGINSNAGGATTCTATGLSLTANGGSSTAGGTASGGNIMNITGGLSGNAVNSGGGSVGVYGVTINGSTQFGGTGVGGVGANGPGGGALGPGGAGSGVPESGLTLLMWNGTAYIDIPAPVFSGGRLLNPMGAGARGLNGRGGPGAGGYGGNPGSAGGFFAGGGGGGGSGTGGYGGEFGGGGGGGAGGGGGGGVGGVIIEYFIK